jgi:hypothetical protein
VVEVMLGALVIAQHRFDLVGLVHGGDSRADAAARQSRCPEM